MLYLEYVKTSFSKKKNVKPNLFFIKKKRKEYVEMFKGIS